MSSIIIKQHERSGPNYNFSFFGNFSKVFHVRPVTQGDVIRADAKEIPRIFQLLYAGEGEARRPEDPNQQDMSTLKGVVDERIGLTTFKGNHLLFLNPFENFVQTRLKIKIHLNIFRHFPQAMSLFK